MQANDFESNENYCNLDLCRTAKPIDLNIESKDDNVIQDFALNYSEQMGSGIEYYGLVLLNERFSRKFEQHNKL